MSKLVLCFLLAFGSAWSLAADRVLRVNDVSDPNAPYAIEMLKLAVSHLDEPYTIEVDHSEVTQARVNEEVRTGGLFDVAWTSADAELEKAMQPVRIPLFKGLLGYRIFIIHRDNQSRFDDIETLEDLREVTVGQGLTWGDTAILESNGFTVVKTPKYPNLFHMVDGGRFEAFPRGVHEPFAELAERRDTDLELAVEQKLMLAYKMPFYFFVSKDNIALANDLELGLNRAIADGSFDRFFINYPAIQDVIAKADMKNRRVFRVDNPLLSAETPLDRAELWFDPSQSP